MNANRAKSKPVPPKKAKSKAVKANKLTGRSRYHHQVQAAAAAHKQERVRRVVASVTVSSPPQCLSPSIQSVHQSLLELILRENLSQKSYVSTGAKHKPAFSRNSSCSSSTTIHHRHPVYHDHFSTLGSQHIPEEFWSPVNSLPVSVPIEVYRSSASARQIWGEHSYASVGSRSGRVSKKRAELKLSVPRSVLGPNSGCYKMPLVLCSHCTTLYVSNNAARSTMCPACVAISRAKLK